MQYRQPKNMLFIKYYIKMILFSDIRIKYLVMKFKVFMIPLNLYSKID